jgi:hypothetical protein
MHLRGESKPEPKRVDREKDDEKNAREMDTNKQKSEEKYPPLSHPHRLELWCGGYHIRPHETDTPGAGPK